MATVKTAISIDKSLFDATQRLARKLKLSRSRLVLMALEQYLEGQQSRRLLARLNAAHAAGPDADEIRLLEASLREHRHLLEGQW